MKTARRPAEPITLPQGAFTVAMAANSAAQAELTFMADRLLAPA